MDVALETMARHGVCESIVSSKGADGSRLGKRCG